MGLDETSLKNPPSTMLLDVPSQNTHASTQYLDFNEYLKYFCFRTTVCKYSGLNILIKKIHGLHLFSKVTLCRSVLKSSFHVSVFALTYTKHTSECMSARKKKKNTHCDYFLLVQGFNRTLSWIVRIPRITGRKSWDEEDGSLPILGITLVADRYWSKTLLLDQIDPWQFTVWSNTSYLGLLGLRMAPDWRFHLLIEVPCCRAGKDMCFLVGDSSFTD